MPETSTYEFRRSAASFIINAFLLGFFFLMFLLGIGLEYVAAMIVAFAAAAWQVVFTVWILMYPYARLEGDRITFYARFQQRKTVRLEDITGFTRRENDVELALAGGDVVSLSLFWMNPADREPFVQVLQPRSEDVPPPGVE